MLTLMLAVRLGAALRPRPLSNRASSSGRRLIWTISFDRKGSGRCLLHNQPADVREKCPSLVA